jgi:hypothetical protein
VEQPATQVRHVIAKAEATKQSILSLRGEMDCFASLAMTLDIAATAVRPSSLAGEGWGEGFRSIDGA